MKEKKTDKMTPTPVLKRLHLLQQQRQSRLARAGSNRGIIREEIAALERAIEVLGR